MKKRVISLMLVASMAAGLMACGSSASSSSSDAASGTEATATAEATTTNTDSDVLYINLASEPDYLDPALNSSVDGGCLAVNTFSGLYTYNSDGELIPDIATDMPEISDDGTVYTISLQETLWSNGDPLTANDFIYSWNRADDPNTAADYAYLFDGTMAKNDDGSLQVEAIDDYTLQITLNAPCPYFTDLLAFPTFMPVHEASVEAADTETPGTWAQEAGFVCNGPYCLTTWNHNESMVYTKNENYHNADKVTINELDFMLSADNTATYAAYNSGDLDFIDDVPVDEIQNLQGSDEFYVVDQLGTYYVAFNVGSSIFDGMTVDQAAAFREAVALLIDRNYIVETVAQTGQQVADSFVPAGMSDGNGGEFKTDDVSYYDAEYSTENVEKAISLLEEAGYEMTDNGDGTYTPNPSITMDYLINDNDTHEKIGECIQQDLQVAGITINIKKEDWNVFLEDRKNGNYDFAREGWVADYNDPINMLELFSSESGNNDPQFGKTDAAAAPDWTEFDNLITEIKSDTDLADRTEKMHEAEDILMSTWAVIPIYYYNDVYMQKSNVTGIYSTVFGMKYFMYAEKN